MISGVVALMQDAAGILGGAYLSPSEVLSILRTTSTPINDPVLNLRDEVIRPVPRST